MEGKSSRRSKRIPRRWFALICATCGLLAALLVFWAPAALQFAELGFARAVSGWGKKAEVREDLVFVGLDDISANLLEQGGLEEEEIAASEALELMSFGKPLPRSVWAILGERLIAAGARAVVFDLLFASETPDDAKFKAMLDRDADRVVVGAEIFDQQQTASGISGSFKMPAFSILQMDGTKDRRVGSVSFKPHADQRVWNASFLQRIDADSDVAALPSLVACTLEQIGESGSIPASLEVGIRFPDFDDYPYEPLPLYTLFFEKTWERNYRSGELFRDKIVVVGGASNMEDDRDDLLTPAGTIRGPQLHMSVLANALTGGEFFHWSPNWLRIGLVMLAALGAFLLVWLSRRPVLGLLAMFGTAVVFVFACIIIFNAGLMLTGVAPIGTFLVAGTLCFGVQFSIERREKLRLKHALDRYVSREISDEILDRPDAFMESLGGRRTTVTVLFSDLRNFTSKSEHADERELVAQLNEYLEEMVACVFEHGGMVDKFIGDAVMAVWGAIRDDGEAVDARAAVAAALDMRSRLAKLNVRWETEGRQTHAFGIGINQGPAIFGNIGSAEKMELTVIGDAVNTASRIEGLTKQFGVDLLVSSSVVRHLDGHADLKPIDKVIPKGKTESVEIFAL